MPMRTVVAIAVVVARLPAWRIDTIGRAAAEEVTNRLHVPRAALGGSESPRRGSAGRGVAGGRLIARRGDGPRPERRHRMRSLRTSVAAAWLVGLIPAVAVADAPNTPAPKALLRLQPTQKGVEYETP